MSKTYNKYEGFTLIEILVVIGLIAVLAAITIVALNPAKQFADARDATRRVDVNTILSAVTQYTVQDGQTLGTLTVAAGGNSIPLCTATPAEIGQDTAGTSTTEINLDAALVEEFLVAIPQDPLTGTADDTGYTICKTAGNRIEVSATGENAGTITVAR